MNAQDNAGRTPAHWCIIIQNSYLLRVLLLNGADHSIQDAEGQTALHLTIRLTFKDGIIAIGKSCPQVVCSFIYEGPYVSSYHYVLPYRPHKYLLVLLFTTLVLQAFEVPSSQSGATPLIYGVQLGKTEIVQTLLEAGCNPNTAESNKYVLRYCK